MLNRFVRTIWRDVLTGVLAGTEAAHVWRYFLGPLARTLWQELSLAVPDQIYAVTPTLWIPSLIGVLSLFLIVPGDTTFLVRLWRTWKAGSFQCNVIIWAVLSCGAVLSLLSGHHFWFGLFTAAATCLTGTQLVLTQREVVREQMRESGTSFIEADEPITTLKEDLLNRAPIVQTLARLAVVDHLHVIALEGPFGDGKTSVLRLLGEALTSDHSDFKETSVASFSPWLAGNSENLPANLMKAIVRAIQKKYYAPRLRQNSLKYVRSSPK